MSEDFMRKGISKGIWDSHPIPPVGRVVIGRRNRPSDSEDNNQVYKLKDKKIEVHLMMLMMKKTKIQL
jgi:hypothetical protein